MPICLSEKKVRIKWIFSSFLHIDRHGRKEKNKIITYHSFIYIDCWMKKIEEAYTYVCTTSKMSFLVAHKSIENENNPLRMTLKGFVWHSTLPKLVNVMTCTLKINWELFKSVKTTLVELSTIRWRPSYRYQDNTVLIRLPQWLHSFSTLFLFRVRNTGISPRFASAATITMENWMPDYE